MGDMIFAGVAIFVVLMIFLGMKKGFIKMLFSLFSMVLILFLIHILTPMTMKFLKTTPIYDRVEGNIYQKVDEYVAKTTIDMLPTGKSNQEKIIDGMTLPKSIKEDLKSNNKDYNSMKVNGLTSYISSYLSEIVLGAVTFIGLFIILGVAFFILIRVLNIFTKLPVIHTFNALGGALMGFVESMMILWILCIVLTVFSTTYQGQMIGKAISENTVLSFVYDHNPLHFGKFLP